jgi:hypothetical protein
MALSDHEFGGVSTNLKLSLVERYLSAFTTAPRGKFKELWYIDAFAGTGERTVKLAARDSDLFDAAQDEQIERHRGSARIAIETEPPFDRLIFLWTRILGIARLFENFARVIQPAKSTFWKGIPIRRSKRLCKGAAGTESER